MQTALVTGATGFLGSALVDALLRRGKRVVCIGRRNRGFLSDEAIHHRQCKFVTLDLRGNIDGALSAYTIDAIFHLAAKQPGRGLDFDDFYSGNVETTRNVIKYAEQSGVSQLVYVSTLSVFGKDPHVAILTEENIPIPTDHYGLTKYMAERLIEIELFQSRVQATVVRFPSLYGRNCRRGVIYTYYQLAKKGEPVEIYHRGQRYRNALYVDDAAQLLTLVSDKREHLGQFEIFSAGSQNSLRMADIAKYIKDFTGSSSRIIPVDKSSSTDWDVYIDITKAKRMLGFEPMTIEEGLKKYVEVMAR